MPVAIHGLISTGPKGNRVYLAFGTNKGGIVQIVDRDKLLKGPKEPTPENLLYPQVGRLDMSPLYGAHTTMPLGKFKIPEFAHDKEGSERDIVMVVGETFREECGEGRQMVFFVDDTIEAKPMVVSHWTVPEASGNFCARGGRFGSHSSNENFGAAVLPEAHLHHLLQCRRARARHPRSLRAEGSRLFHSLDHQGDRSSAAA